MNDEDIPCPASLTFSSINGQKFEIPCKRRKHEDNNHISDMPTHEITWRDRRDLLCQQEGCERDYFNHKKLWFWNEWIAHGNPPNPKI